MKLGELHRITETLLKKGVPYSSTVSVVTSADGFTVKSEELSVIMVNQTEDGKMNVLMFKQNTRPDEKMVG